MKQSIIALSVLLLCSPAAFSQSDVEAMRDHVQHKLMVLEASGQLNSRQANGLHAKLGLVSKQMAAKSAGRNDAVITRELVAIEQQIDAQRKPKRKLAGLFFSWF